MDLPNVRQRVCKGYPARAGVGEREPLEKPQEKEMIPFPNKKYKTILADPPWRYNRDWWPGSKKSAFAPKYNQRTVPMPYPEMTVDEIKALPVQSIADENCEMYLWVTQKYLPIAFDVIKAWGFKYCQTLTWCKKPMGTGQGGAFTPTTEF